MGKKISKTGNKYFVTENTTMAQVDLDVKNKIRWAKHYEINKQKKHFAERDIIRMAIDKMWPQAEELEASNRSRVNSRSEN